MTFERFVEDVPYGAIPCVGLGEGDVCFVLTGHGQVVRANPVVSRRGSRANRRRVLPIVLSIPTGLFFASLPMIEEDFLMHVRQLSPVALEDPDFEVTLRVLRSHVPGRNEERGLSIALVISALTAEPSIVERRPYWAIVGDFLED